MTIENALKVKRHLDIPYFDLIPDEMMIAILEYIPKIEVIQLSILSKRFYRVIHSKELYLDDIYSARKLHSVLMGADFLQNEQSALISMMRTISATKSTLQKMSPQEIGSLNVAEIVERAPPLIFEKLWERNVISVLKEKVLASLKICPSYTLKNDLTDPAFKLMLKSLGSMKVKSVCIPSSLTQQQRTYFTDMLYNNELDIQNIALDSFNELHSPELSDIIRSLEGNRSVTSISTSHIAIGDAEFKLLLEALKVNTTLRSLKFNGFVCTPEGFGLLAEICAHQCIENLTLQQFIEVEVRVLCDSLTNIELNTLSLNKGYISESTAQSIVSMLKENPGIQTLNLMYNQITQEAQKIFVKANRSKKIVPKIVFLRKL